MTNQHRATPDEWAQQEDWANRSVSSDSSCIIELRGRIEALEATQQPQQPSLKQKLLQKLERISDVADGYQDTRNAIDDLRSALEALNE